MSRKQVGRFLILGEKYPIYEGMNVIGRDLEATVTLRNLVSIRYRKTKFSKRHAVISVIEDRHYLTDHNSINGTRLRGKKLEPFLFYRLNHKAIITMGDVVGTYHIESEIQHDTSKIIQKQPLINESQIKQSIENTILLCNETLNVSNHQTDTSNDLIIDESFNESTNDKKIDETFFIAATQEITQPSHTIVEKTITDEGTIKRKERDDDCFLIPTQTITTPNKRKKHDDFSAPTQLLNDDNDDTFLAPTQVIRTTPKKTIQPAPNDPVTSNEDDCFLAPTQVIETTPKKTIQPVPNDPVTSNEDDCFLAPTQVLHEMVPKSTKRTNRLSLKRVVDEPGQDDDFFAPTQPLHNSTMNNVMDNNEDDYFMATTQQLKENSSGDIMKDLSEEYFVADTQNMESANDSMRNEDDEFFTMPTQQLKTMSKNGKAKCRGGVSKEPKEARKERGLVKDKNIEANKDVEVNIIQNEESRKDCEVSKTDRESKEKDCEVNEKDCDAGDVQSEVNDSCFLAETQKLETVPNSTGPVPNEYQKKLDQLNDSVFNCETQKLEAHNLGKLNTTGTTTYTHPKSSTDQEFDFLAPSETRDDDADFIAPTQPLDSTIDRYFQPDEEKTPEKLDDKEKTDAIVEQNDDGSKKNPKSNEEEEELDFLEQSEPFNISTDETDDDIDFISPTQPLVCKSTTEPEPITERVVDAVTERSDNHGQNDSIVRSDDKNNSVINRIIIRCDDKHKTDLIVERSFLENNNVKNDLTSERSSVKNHNDFPITNRTVNLSKFFNLFTKTKRNVKTVDDQNENNVTLTNKPDESATSGNIRNDPIESKDFHDDEPDETPDITEFPPPNDTPKEKQTDSDDSDIQIIKKRPSVIPETQDSDSDIEIRRKRCRRIVETQEIREPLSFSFNESEVSNQMEESMKLFMSPDPVKNVEVETQVELDVIMQGDVAPETDRPENPLVCVLDEDGMKSDEMDIGNTEDVFGDGESVGVGGNGSNVGIGGIETGGGERTEIGEDERIGGKDTDDTRKTRGSKKKAKVEECKKNIGTCEDNKITVTVDEDITVEANEETVEKSSVKNKKTFNIKNPELKKQLEELEPTQICVSDDDCIEIISDTERLDEDFCNQETQLIGYRSPKKNKERKVKTQTIDQFLTRTDEQTRTKRKDIEEEKAKGAVKCKFNDNDEHLIGDRTNDQENKTNDQVEENKTKGESSRGKSTRSCRKSLRLQPDSSNDKNDDDSTTSDASTSDKGKANKKRSRTTDRNDKKCLKGSENLSRKSSRIQSRRDSNKPDTSDSNTEDDVPTGSKVMKVEAVPKRTTRHKTLSTIAENASNETPRKKQKTEDGPDTNRNSQRTPSSRNTGRIKHKIVFTMLDDTNLEATAGRLGGSVVNSSEQCTVLVTSKICRSLKFLTAVALHKPIVSPRWIIESGKSHRFLDPWDFILDDEENERKHGFKLRDAIATDVQILNEYNVLMVTNKNADVLKSIIEINGGNCIKKLPGKINKNTLVVAYEEDHAKYKKYLDKNPLLNVVAAEAIFEGCLQQKLDLKKYFLT